ncbi:hypothetical protein M3Y99_00314600 [Aphelenchoides fujianensis]|nr:hypothetical protein M3Y99_00314600 [Aphelenchoides fujianensis]
MFRSLSFNNLMAQQLAAATIAILSISAVLIIAMIAFRCYMLYCRTYDNTVTYQMPAYRTPRTRNPNAEQKKNLGLFFWRKNGGEDAANSRTSHSFQSIFQDPDIES